MDLFYFPIMLNNNIIILFITTITVAKQHLTVKTSIIFDSFYTKTNNYSFRSVNPLQTMTYTSQFLIP